MGTDTAAMATAATALSGKSVSCRMYPNIQRGSACCGNDRSAAPEH